MWLTKNNSCSLAQVTRLFSIATIHKCNVSVFLETSYTTLIWLWNHQWWQDGAKILFKEDILLTNMFFKIQQLYFLLICYVVFDIFASYV